MTSKTRKLIITILILPNISRGKDNQIIKFGQLKEYNLRKRFLEKSYPKYSGKASTRPFSKSSKLSISLAQLSQMLKSLFLLYVQAKIYQNTLSLRC